MSIKKATLIALCGNAAALLICLLMSFDEAGARALIGRHIEAIVLLLGYGTLVFFLFTLYRK
jgi:hypothetical protein